MINLDPQISQIEDLLARGDAQSLTYAALECRLAIERICYNRLRIVHDYISHSHLKRWQPKHVVNTLIRDVDPSVATTRKLYISKLPSDTYGADGPTDDDYFEVGTEIGFNSDLLGKLWNALSNLALHVRLPKNKGEPVDQYGNAEPIAEKVREALAELKKIGRSTMSMSSVFGSISFQCACSATNKRAAEALREGTVVNCVNPDCDWSYSATLDGDTWRFQPIRYEFNCRCGATCSIPARTAHKTPHGESADFNCHLCRHPTRFKWMLARVAEDGDPA